MSVLVMVARFVLVVDSVTVLTALVTTTVSVPVTMVDVLVSRVVPLSEAATFFVFVMTSAVMVLVAVGGGVEVVVRVAVGVAGPTRAVHREDSEVGLAYWVQKDQAEATFSVT